MGGGGGGRQWEVTGPGDTENYFPFAVGNTWTYRETSSASGAAAFKSGAASSTVSSKLLNLIGKHTKRFAVAKSPAVNFITTTITGTKVVNGVTVTVFTSGGEESYYLKDSNGITYYGNNDPTATLTAQLVPYQMVNFPIEPGSSFVQVNKTGLDVGEDLDGDGKNETADAYSTVTVVGFESVAVPVGNFPDCARIETNLTLTVKLSLYNTTVTARGVDTTWVAPGIGIVKETTVVTVDNSSYSETETYELTGYTVDGQTVTAPDTTMPMVNSTNPSYGAIGVAVNSAISATFSEAMDTSTINATNFTVSTGGSNISGTVTYDATNKVATFTPLANLAYSTTYTATITTGVKDLAGNMMAANYAWSFTTGSIPPNPPTNVTATAGDGQVALSWSTVSDAWSYNIYWSTTPGVTKATGTKIPIYYYSYTHSGLNNGTTYYYVVTSISSYGMESSESSEVSATPQAGATMPLTNDATNIMDTTATFNGSFNNPSGYTTTVWFEYGTTTSYGSTTTPAAYATTGTIPLSTNITALQQATTYHYRIVTQNSGGTFYGNDKSFRTYITPQVLATGLTNPMDIAVDPANVYWIEGGYPGTVKKVGINGGTVTTLASDLSTSNGGKIAVDSTSVYWTERGISGNDGAVKKVGIGGGTITTLASGLSYPLYVAVDSTSVYWIEGMNVKKISKDGGTVTTLVSGSNYLYGIAVDSTSVYWTESGAVKKVGINGGLVTVIASAVGSGAIAVDASYVYWNDGGSLRKVGKDGGTVTTLATGIYFYDIAVDATSVYWIESGAVKKVSVNGGTVTTLAVEQMSYSPIAIDAASVYYIGGTWAELMIKKVPKSY